ncbi:MAG: hypothetical protein A3I01_07570 [Betaproteobacteria bacterium RIFCSPLOWO2_02_FULL_65_24]|nr:MAG: hypothetical protein A3I01_07570 [Betaproteobacteria bacterium RIFCSPLOWO2_02_FULL_65_24]OGA87239.1 MAG: hypothetical protein A3G27_00460 [Betaproteobacteria bacterium RIFCSPLOWO2_12_FULL_66_14]
MNYMVALLASLFVAGFALLPDDAEAARRLGGARNLGAQRQVTPPPQKAAPAQQQAAPANNAAKPAAPAPAGNRWLGPLAGLAAGLGLGWLLSQGGFGALLSALVLALLVGVAIFALLRIFGKPRSQAQPMQYASLGREPVSAPPAAPRVLGSAGGTAAPALNVPAGFDVAGFVKQARLNFMRLQAANDRGDLETLRDVTTEELFNELSADVASRQGKPQQTDVAGLEASLLEVTTDGDTHWASVSFQGTVRDDDSGAATPFHEIWHLQKAVKGDSGWLLAGIQQAS